MRSGKVEYLVITAIIAAAGSGRRMGENVNKVFLPLCGRPILVHSFLTLAACPEITEIVVVAAPGEEQKVEHILALVDSEKKWRVVTGGSERQYSIANAIAAVSESAEIIIVHDGARPLVEAETVGRAVAAARQFGAAGVAVPVKDTIKTVSGDGFISGTPDRARLWAMQTPQAFGAGLLRQAYAAAAADGYLGTDDAALVERIGVKVKIVDGSYTNLKITTPEDLLSGEALVKKGAGTMSRFGIGYDVHKLVSGRKLILGGVEIPFELGLEGHSDADVLLHAIMDALLGAAALGDIGRHFPDTDEQYKGAASLKLLSRVGGLLKENGWAVNNIDAVIVAQKPKLMAYMAQMNANIEATLELSARQVNIKATTTEGLGFAGRREGIAAYAAASIVRTY